MQEVVPNAQSITSYHPAVIHATISPQIVTMLLIIRPLLMTSATHVIQDLNMLVFSAYIRMIGVARMM